MKSTLQHLKLSKSLSYASRAVSNKPNIPVLSNIQIEAKKNSIDISATNLDMGIQISVPGQIESTGKTTVNGKYISDFVNATKSDSINIEQDENNLILKTSGSEAKFTTISAEEFPVLPQIKGEPLFTINKDDFIEAMNKVIFACSTDLSAGRIQQSGVFFDINKEEKTISFVGLDGFRLSRKTVEVENLRSEIKKEEIIVPARYISELTKILGDHEDVDTLEVFLGETSAQMIFKFEDIEFSIRLLEGPYPDYKKILPEENSYSFEVKKSDIEESVKIVNSFARGNLGNKTLFDFDLENSRVTLISTVSDVGEGKSMFNVVGANGESDLNTAYALRFLQDVVNHIDGEDIIFETKGPLAASVFKDKSDPNFLHLIMPLRRDN